MKNLLFVLSCVLFLNSTEIIESSSNNLDYNTCWVTLVFVDPDTGDERREYYYSNSRVSDADCAQGMQDMLNGNFMMTSDFRKSPVIAPM